MIRPAAKHRLTKREGAIDWRPTIRTFRAMTTIKLDLSGLKRPLPALKTRKALKSLAPGDRLEVRCTDPLAVIDIPHLVGMIGDRLEIIERGERDTVFRIEKSAPSLASKPPPC
jgi:tRNA 2-thiouridine synthesizing protein A